MTSRAASCIRIRTRATRSRAAPRSPCSTSSRDDDVIAVNRARPDAGRDFAAPLAAHPAVRHFRQTGMIIAFDVATTRPDFARWCFAEGLKRELLLRPIGRTLYFMPPYIVTDDEFAALVAGDAGHIGRRMNRIAILRRGARRLVRTRRSRCCRRRSPRRSAAPACHRKPSRSSSRKPAPCSR